GKSDGARLKKPQALPRSPMLSMRSHSLPAFRRSLTLLMFEAGGPGRLSTNLGKGSKSQASKESLVGRNRQLQG
ncbi:hypothetical protein QBC45DRAFT_317456, partial [Copromyces sp. CBS 386.78]